MPRGIEVWPLATLIYKGTPPSHGQWKQSCWIEEHHNSADSLNLTIDNLEHVALVATALGYDPLNTAKELPSLW